MGGTLVIVGTPIGNLGDLSERGRSALASADLIAAEDTRRTGILLRHAGIDGARMISLFDANEPERIGRLLAELRDGATVALVSDGGMPLVADPGYKVVTAAIAEGYTVEVVPGPSAVLAALVLSGLPMERFVFEGFLPKKAGERRRRLGEIRDDRRTVVLFESPKRVAATLGDIVDVLGDRRIALCRELTKLHEDVRRGTVTEVADGLGDLKGEVVLVVEGSRGEADVDPATLASEARELVEGGMRMRDAARAVATRHGAPTNQVYDLLVGSKGSGEAGS
jgi:16S rRNA (cytidine1402-2'-O)-methyltransferase